MKLLRVFLGTPFRSLPSGFEVKFNMPISDDPICLVGINGSGKSNLLEALAEIFSYLNTPYLNFIKHYTDRSTINHFEIEYLIPKYYAANSIRANLISSVVERFVHIKVVKEVDTIASYYLIHNDEQIDVESSPDLLPQRIIGYSSGQNEILSIPFYKILFKYFHNLREEQKRNDEDFYSEEEAVANADLGRVEYGRLQFLSYNDSPLLILSNLLSLDDNLDGTLFSEIGNIRLVFCELTIRRELEVDGGIHLTAQARKVLDFLYESATEIIDTNLFRIVRILVTDELKAKFKDQYIDASGIFNALYNLSLINLNGISNGRMNTLLRGQDSIYLNYRASDFETRKLFFRVTRLEIDKDSVDAPISYKELSDGEHQFLHTLCAVRTFKDDVVLYLMDEPETHYNPKWKYEYFQLLKNSGYNENSQIVLTTHDPVLLAGLKKESVLVFNKPTAEKSRTFKPVKDLKGMGVDAILMSDVFGFDTSIDLSTKGELIELKELYIKRMKQQDLSSAEEKRYDELYEKLRDLDYSKPLNDPLYREYLKGLEELGLYNRTFLTEEEKKLRSKYSKEAIARIQELYNK